MKSVLISVQPKWCELIASGKKTIEVRKTRPKLETPFKVYIYCTKNKRQWLRKINNFVREIFLTENKDIIGRTDKVKSLIGDWTTFVENGGYNGKVIGEFVCDVISEYECSSDGFGELATTYGTCLTYDEIVNYCNGNDLYGWHISNLVIYDKPKELSEFYVWKKCNACRDTGYESTACMYDENCKVPAIITRPPQSWRYCESEVDTE